jgi:hypothetical protein
VNRAVDRRKFWNRNPRLRRVEIVLKALIVAFVALAITGIGGFVLDGLTFGWAIACAGFPAALLWHTASKLTRHDAYWRPATAWFALLLLVAPLPWVPRALAPAAPIPFAAAVATSVACLALAAAVPYAARRFVAWKTRLVHGSIPS